MAKTRGPYIKNASRIGAGGKQLIKKPNSKWVDAHRKAYGKPKPKASPVKIALKSTTSLTSPSSKSFAKTVKVAKAKPVRRVSPQMRQAVKKTVPPKNVQKTIKRKPPTKGR